ncbi:hypothetical protein C8F04DRAFT_954042 [Mycena alexandri]|uniref:Uncharacterized protein n=1 Tax=Mycena alexandri TaxID=1745969 RepID=A0AAD6SZ91_9AGAR|nr:hypothetical protein C8F04DRAFT_954042 [Mycena alexandri]
MASFDPVAILAILVALQPSGVRSKFESDWKKNVCTRSLLHNFSLIFLKQVDTRLISWQNNRATQSNYKPQLQFEANVAKYDMALHREIRPPTVAKTSTKIPQPKALKPGLPIYGPKFIPPSLKSFVGTRRTILSGPLLRPLTATLINIIHPVYYPTLGNCPHCGSSDVRWDGWNGTGSREVHGLRREKTALGYQLQHDKCTPDEGTTKPRNRAFASTNQLFWENWEHWKIPRRSSSPSKTAVYSYIFLARWNSNFFQSLGDSPRSL